MQRRIGLDGAFKRRKVLSGAIARNKVAIDVNAESLRDSAAIVRECQVIPGPGFQTVIWRRSRANVFLVASLVNGSTARAELR